MRILLAVGSPRKYGNTFKLAEEFKKQAEIKGHIVDFLALDDYTIKPCNHCGFCIEKRECKHFDELREVLINFEEKYNGIIIASPIYFFYLTAQTKLFLDRLYSVNLSHKFIGAILVSGSEFFEGGNDLVIDSLKRVCNYCNSIFVGVVQKTTYDDVLDLSENDKSNIEKLILSIENNNNINSSIFIDY
ncbi:MAG: flavodoxin family protein [Thermosipho sp. (in: Bacteria)]|nr:flavodoxin family protein [Thermosipho sp. (in: thermotogales)]